MSIDSTFKPMTATYQVDSTGAVQIKEAKDAGASSFRLRNVNAAAAYVTWGGSGVTSKGAPVLGTPSVNTIGIPIGGVAYIEVPPASFFIASVAAPAVEITGGEGGNGG